MNNASLNNDNLIKIFYFNNLFKYPVSSLYHIYVDQSITTGWAMWLNGLASTYEAGGHSSIPSQVTCPSFRLNPQ